MKFQKLFTKSDQRIAALRGAVDENLKEQRWCWSFHHRKEALEKALGDAKKEFFRKPTPAGGEAVLEAARAFHPVKDDLWELGQIAWRAEEPKQSARLIDAIQPALDAVIERLEETLRGIEKTDAEKAAALEMEHSDVESPVRKRIDAAIGEARDFKQALTAGNMARLQPAIDFIIKGTEAAVPDVFKR